jgi:hypothetical protein
MKGETLRMYRATAALNKATIIPLVQWSFIRPGLHLSPDDLFAPLKVNPKIVLERMAIPEIPIEELVTSETMRPQIATDGELRRRHRIPGPREFAVSLQPYVDKAVDTCPLCGHVEEEKAGRLNLCNVILLIFQRLLIIL